MRALLSVMAVLTLMGLAAWAYSENYATRSAAAERAALQREIGALQHEKSMLEGEFTYLARPDRLRALAELTFADLQLVPMTPDAFGRMQEIPYPPPIEANEIGVESLALTAAGKEFP